MVYLSVMRKFVKILGVLAVAAGLAAAAQGPARAQAALTVVELYTSQGCSSCPPADAFLSDLAERADVLALSFHVDYWDYIGWKDPFASKAFTQRQRAYQGTFRRGYIYTPQMIVQGAFDATGSDRVSINRAISQAGGFPRVRVRIDYRPDGGLDVRIGGGTPGAPMGVWLALFDSLHVTKVRRGENRGRTVRNVNVVRSLVKIGVWTGKRAKILVPAKDLDRGKRDGGAVFIQADRKGPILGAARVVLKDAK